MNWPLELLRCSPLFGFHGFARFCRLCLKIEDKGLGRSIPFSLWPSQLPIAEQLVVGEWLIVLKARQVGLTWLVVAYALWRMLYTPLFTVVVVAQKEEYATKILATKFNHLYRKLPAPFRQGARAKVKDDASLIRLANGAEIHAVAGTEDAGRSDTINLVILDECARIKEAAKCFQGAGPGLDNAKGQCVLITSSRGPQGWFYDQWQAADAGATRFRHVFLPWDAHPQRDTAWYEREQGEHASDPNYMRQEFPASVEEAFEAAAGRVYPLFLPRTHAETLDIPYGTLRYRGIDWGETSSAFVCLWVAHVPSDTPRLTYDATHCPNFAREMMGYHYKEDTDKPDKVDDHAPDALRMVVVTFNLTGHVHVYRELYIRDPKGRGEVAATLCCQIKEYSGWQIVDRDQNLWRPGPGVEQYAGTCFDRSKPILANELARQGIDDAIPHAKATLDTAGLDSDVAQGIILVNDLVVGTVRYESEREQTQRELELAKLRESDPLHEAGYKVGHSLQHRLILRKRMRELDKRRGSPYLS